MSSAPLNPRRAGSVRDRERVVNLSISSQVIANSTARRHPAMMPLLVSPTVKQGIRHQSIGSMMQVSWNRSSSDRVYVNPGRSCGTCRHCWSGDPIACDSYTFNGYFGFSPLSKKLFERYPYGGLSEYMTAPVSALVKLPGCVSFNRAARFGYIGTAYSGLRKAKVGSGSRVLINGGSGTLGVGAVISALALGASKIFATGRNRGLLASVKGIAPGR